MFAKVMPRLGSPPKDRSAAPFLFVSGLMRCPKATESCRPIKSLIPVFFSTHHPRIETIEARPLPALVHRSPRILWHGLSPSFLLVSTSHLQQTGNSEDTTPSFSFWLVSQGAVPLIHLFASLPESINGPRYVGGKYVSRAPLVQREIACVQSLSHWGLWSPKIAEDYFFLSSRRKSPHRCTIIAMTRKGRPIKKGWIHQLHFSPTALPSPERLH